MKRIGVIALLTTILMSAFAVAAGATETTRDEYTAAVEPICKANAQASERILAGAKGEVRQGKLKPVAAKFSKAAAALGKTLAELRQVPPPTADKARIEGWLKDVKTEQELFTLVAKKLRKGDKNGAERLVVKLSVNANKTNNKMIPFDFRYCRFEPSKFT